MDEFVYDLGHVGGRDLVISKIRFSEGKSQSTQNKANNPNKGPIAKKVYKYCPSI